jgi:hypothetical protein
MSVKLKNSVTNEMLESIGFRIVRDLEVRALRLHQNGSHDFITHDGEVLSWGRDRIQDMIDNKWVEIGEEE